MKRNLLCLLAFSVMLWSTAIAQTIPDKSARIAKLAEIGKPNSENGWLYFKKGLKDKPEDILKKYGPAFGLSSDDEMLLIDTHEDELNLIRYRFKQYYKGYEVEGSDYSIYANRIGSSSEVPPQFAFGTIIQGIKINNKSLVSEQKALRAALKHIGPKKFIWQDTSYENSLKRQNKSLEATYYPKGKLVISSIPGANDTIAENYRICYKYQIQTLAPYDNFEIYMDAVNGKFIKTNTLIQTCSIGNVSTLYNGQQQFTTHHRGWPNNDYVLRDECRNNIETQEINGFHIKDNDNIWNDNKERNAATAHWAAQKAFDYFLSAHNRRGTDPKNRSVALKVMANTLFSYHKREMHYNYDEIGIGYASNGASEAALDLVGHEYTHAITKRSAGLSNQKEPGALNESFSDIFGLMIERYVKGDQPSIWTVGEDAKLLRYINYPNFQVEGKYQPDYYEQSGVWHPVNKPDNDNYGVHTNMGVQNKWFYLLSMGERHYGMQVYGIGIDKAAKIAFRNLTTYLGENSGYYAARSGSIQAAIDLYGACSNEVRQTMNAWAAVGVGSPAPDLCISPISGVTELCAEMGGPAYLVYSVSTSPGARVSWSLYHSGFDWYQSGNQLIITRTPTHGNSSAYITATATDGVNISSSNLAVNVSYCYGGQPCPPDQLCESMLEMSQSASNITSQVAKPKIYPNPAIDQLSIEMPSDHMLGRVTIKEITGRVLKEIYLGGLSKIDVNLESFKTGTYILEISTSKGKYVEKLVVTK